MIEVIEPKKSPDLERDPGIIAFSFIQLYLLFTIFLKASLNSK